MDRMLLVGSDDVTRGGSMMQSAASDMQRAALNLEGTFERYQRFMDDWLQRFEMIVDKVK